MACYSPLQGWRSKTTNPNGKRNIVFNKNEGFEDMEVQLPCGRCIGCRLEYSRQWAIRCMHEAQMHPNNVFITLTYSDENLPENENLSKRDFQLFMKRLRKKFGKGIRYFACGEYGTKKNRPHYHAIIFGLDFNDKELWTIRNENRLYISKTLDKLWTNPESKEQYGWATIGEVTFESAAYVARYCMKKRKGKEKGAWYCKEDPVTGESIEMQEEFSLMSRRPGVGKLWLEKYGADVYPHDHIVHDGVPMKSAKYYDNLYEKENPTSFAQIKYQRKKMAAQREEEKPLYRAYIKGKVKELTIKRLQRSIENDV